MRIVGLPIGCLVLLAAIAIKAGTAASRPPAIEPLPDQTTAGSGVPQDTLTKADKLEIAYVRKVAPVCTETSNPDVMVMKPAEYRM